ncbi:hypothetical protein BKA67DRAFT_337046 [Truncatella angustata]|uniref:Zn(2)-C6 fungal-type domain-containing protein n=1 Tax=Truncatella angustata TaxID=152316 RepID=A0A9P8UGN1_9PEZI|nr:uncharacterized protein BKA67DRAFT_337046 [Truncatella angustata]KAH6651754.1 hypothetical protein BKA67DRAFT_337046 [Truncatella angustata]
MVYTGPSKGCLACLKRRVKCDEGKPQCQRCQKAGRECPGYRDPSRIKIRDMTATTINRFEYDRAGPKAKEDGLFDQNYSQSVISLRTRMNEETRRFRGAQAHDDDDDNDEEQTDPVAKRTASNQRSASPSAGWNDNAMNTFVSRSALRVPPWTPPGQHAIAYLTNCYLNVEHQSMDPGYLDVLKLVMRRRNPGQCLQSTLSTLALAAFSRRPVSRAATLDTQASYSVALKTVNDAIGAPGSIFDDELLASIVILALVECLISTKTTGYFNHLYGGITILKARGKRKFHDELGAELFMLLRFELNINNQIRRAARQILMQLGEVSDGDSRQPLPS